MNDFERGYEVSGFSLLDIRNRNETRIAEAMRRLLPDPSQFCGCRLCVEDVFAASLNQSPALYVQTGSIVLRKIPSKDELDVIVREAFARVGNHPKHRPNNPDTDSIVP